MLVVCLGLLCKQMSITKIVVSNFKIRVDTQKLYEVKKMKILFPFT